MSEILYGFMRKIQSLLPMNNVYFCEPVHDEKAFIIVIRSSVKNEPKIFNIQDTKNGINALRILVFIAVLVMIQHFIAIKFGYDPTTRVILYE